MKKIIITLVLFFAVCLVLSMNLPTKILGAVIGIVTVYICAIRDESTKSESTKQY